MTSSAKWPKSAKTFKVDPSTFGDYILTSFETFDVRFPTSDDMHGSDAIHDPDYSNPYLLLKFVNNNPNNNRTSASASASASNANGTQPPHEIIGHGLTFTLGRGSEVVIACIGSLFEFIRGRSLKEITDDPLSFSRSLTCDPQFRWLGPEKGVAHLAVCAINNAVFDVWSWCHGQPLWQFLAEMDVATLILKCADFQYLMDTPGIDQDLTQNVIQPLRANQRERMPQRTAHIRRTGYPLYVTGAGWLGYTDAQIARLCREYMAAGFSAFKMKIGRDVEDDIRRAAIMRDTIGYGAGTRLMMDANQVWEISQSVAWMKRLARFRPYWIEEPTSPDDVLGHLRIARALNPLGIKVASGEMCQNRVLWRQFLESGALQIAQLDTGRLNSVLEIVAVLVLCQKFRVPVCFHAGGSGLNEMVRHYIMLDYVLISQTLDDGRICEYAQHLAEHFEEECVHQRGRYYPPQQPGFVRMKMESVRKYLYPSGPVWQRKLRRDRAKL